MEFQLQEQNISQAGTSRNLSGGDINSGLATGKCHRYHFSFFMV